MRRFIFLLAFIIIILSFQSCEKDNQQNVDQVTMKFDGKTFKSASINNFEIISDTSKWNLYPGGVMTIDDNNQFNGNSSLKLVSTSSCFHVEKIEGVPVTKDKIYVIHFFYHEPVTTMEELNNGFMWTCMGPCRLELKQGNDVILSEWLAEIDDWAEKYFYFQPNNNIPVKIELLVGTRKGIWLDDLIVLEEY